MIYRRAVTGWLDYSYLFAAAVNLDRESKSWLVRALQKQLWSDSLTDSLLCYSYALIALLIGFPMLILAHMPLGLAPLAVGAMLIAAGVGLHRRRRWAALAATIAFALTGSILLSFHFAARADELRDGP